MAASFCEVEGLETAGPLAMRRDLGCDRMQGYLFARPNAATASERERALRGLSAKIGA